LKQYERFENEVDKCIGGGDTRVAYAMEYLLSTLQLEKKQESQLSQRGCAMLRVVEDIAVSLKSLENIRNYTDE